MLAKLIASCLALGAFAFCVSYLVLSLIPVDDWSVEEVAQIQSLQLDKLPGQPPIDKTNLVANQPIAQTLGHHLFFDSRLSSTGKVSCASCHDPNLSFTDGLKTSIATGSSKRNAPSLLGLPYSPWFYWDGRKDSQWSQALSPLEDPAEHASNRLFYAKLIFSDSLYKGFYENLFGVMPDLSETDRFPEMVGPFSTQENQMIWSQMAPDARHSINEIFSNVGKALASYQRLLLHGPSRFDNFNAEDNQGTTIEEGSQMLSPQESRGLRLFIGKASCTNCHNGPLFSNNSFHNTGLLSSPGKLPDIGRIKGIREAKKDPFNCLGSFSDSQQSCMELVFAKSGKEMVGAFRTPSLRNLRLTGPYGHAGQQETLKDVLEHYNEAPDAMIGHNEAKPLDLWPWEMWQLESFLESLDSPPAVDEKWLRPPLYK